MSRAASVLALAGACLVLACAPDRAPGSGDPGAQTVGDTVSDALERAQARVTRKVIDLAGVTGTAVGMCNGKPCIKVYVEAASDSLRRRLPRSEGGYPVVVEVTGKFRSR